VGLARVVALGANDVLANVGTIVGIEVIGVTT
jgi:hypothetical protein